MFATEMASSGSGGVDNLVELVLIDKGVARSTGAIVWFHAIDRDDDVKDSQ